MTTTASLHKCDSVFQSRINDFAIFEIFYHHVDVDIASPKKDQMSFDKLAIFKTEIIDLNNSRVIEFIFSDHFEAIAAVSQER